MYLNKPYYEVFGAAQLTRLEFYLAVNWDKICMSFCFVLNTLVINWLLRLEQEVQISHVKSVTGSGCRLALAPAKYFTQHISTCWHRKFTQ